MDVTLLQIAGYESVAILVGDLTKSRSVSLKTCRSAEFMTWMVDVLQALLSPCIDLDATRRIKAG